jgi:hypothetical protein
MGRRTPTRPLVRLRLPYLDERHRPGPGAVALPRDNPAELKPAPLNIGEAPPLPPSGAAPSVMQDAPTGTTRRFLRGLVTA